MSTLQLLQAAVKFAACPPKDFGNGPRINVVCTAGDEEIKLWGNPEDPLAALKKGDSVSLIYDGKSYKLASTAPPEAAIRSTDTPPPPPPSDYPANLGQAVAHYELAWKSATALLKRNGGDAGPASFDIIQRIAAELFRAAR
ncbi:MAG: hypothetical protein ACR2FS_17920 [Phormidesmis sp.]